MREAGDQRTGLGLEASRGLDFHIGAHAELDAEPRRGFESRQSLTRECLAVLATRVETGQLPAAQSGHSPAAVGGPIDRLVMNKDRDRIERQHHVELHPGAAEGCGETDACKRVLRCQGTAAAMGEQGRPGPGPEGVAAHLDSTTVTATSRTHNRVVERLLGRLAVCPHVVQLFGKNLSHRDAPRIRRSP